MIPGNIRQSDKKNKNLIYIDEVKGCTGWKNIQKHSLVKNNTHSLDKQNSFSSWKIWKMENRNMVRELAVVFAKAVNKIR